MIRRPLRPLFAAALLSTVGGFLVIPSALAQSAAPGGGTNPTTRPAASKPADPRSVSSDQLLGQMLRQPPTGQPKPLQPIPEPPAGERLIGPPAVKPNAPAVPTLREGTLLVDRPGRLVKTPDGSQTQFVFEADGKAMKDPPMTILPNIQLMAMENAVSGAARDLRFRVTGTVTEYRGKNYLLLMKVLVVPDATQQF